MPGKFEQEPRVPEQFEPSPATKAAWEARSFLLQLHDSKPGSVQAEVAKEAADREFAEVVTLTQGKVYGSLLARTKGNREAAAEILQETYIRAYKGLPKFRGDAQVETWLHQISFSRLSTYYKKEAKHLGNVSLSGYAPASQEPINFEESVMDDSEDFAPEAQAMAGELRKELLDAIEELPPRHGIALRLHGLMGWSHEKIAEHLDISVGNSRVIVHRAQRSLRKLLQAEE